MTEQLNSFEGLSAVVTGATRGIGYAIAQQLTDLGTDVLTTGTKEDGTGPDGSTYRAVDFTDTAATRAFADDIRSLGPDILINNAGINKIGAFADYDPADFERIQRVNVEAPFLLCQAALPGMKAKEWGRIVNISSIWSKITKAERSAYAASKFALDGMTVTLAAENARDGILANCVAPGFIETDMTREILGPEGIADIAAQIPAGRLGNPEEVARLVVWLAGPENTYVSGQNIAIDGGFTRV